MTPNCHRVISGGRNLFYDPKGHGDLFRQFDLAHDPNRLLLVAVTYIMTTKVAVTFSVGLT